MIIVGIEIENILNRDLFSFEVGNYHEGYPLQGLDGWLAERDSSLHYNDIDLEERGFLRSCNEDVIPTELISPTCRGKTKFMKELENFKKYFSKDGEYELNQVFLFNRTCGAHIHVSCPGLRHFFYTKGTKKCFIETRNHFLKKIKASKLPEEIKKKIAKHYDRSYAKQSWVGYRRRDVRMASRDVEFNFNSEVNGRGLEWRSINMYGIKTWKQFMDFWKIVFDSVEFMVKQVRIWTEREAHNINPTIKEAMKNREVICKDKFKKPTKYRTIDVHEPKIKLLSSDEEILVGVPDSIYQKLQKEEEARVNIDLLPHSRILRDGSELQAIRLDDDAEWEAV